MNNTRSRQVVIAVMVIAVVHCAMGCTAATGRYLTRDRTTINEGDRIESLTLRSGERIVFNHAMARASWDGSPRDLIIAGTTLQNVKVTIPIDSVRDLRVEEREPSPANTIGLILVAIPVTMYAFVGIMVLTGAVHP
jgi:hypothetical protein